MIAFIPRLITLLAFLFSISGLKAEPGWKAQWISYPSSQNASNSWYCFRKDFSIETFPTVALAKIAADSKYWMWINDSLVVFEGGLKRGPNPADTYYDEVDIAPFLDEGENTVAILQWYFGKDGFSHVSSGKAGFLFECIAPGLDILSDRSWKVRTNQAYETCTAPHPNRRLPESSIRYDARYSVGKWTDPDFNDGQWPWMPAMELGTPPSAPWNELVIRPIPQWKFSELLPYKNHAVLPEMGTGDTICCLLPANIHITPYLKIDAPEGLLISIQTDNFMGGGVPNVRAEYVTTRGVQEYESFGWINGHKVYYVIPSGVKILDLKYRESGYNTEFSGSFHSSDAFLNTLWEKARRTLYVTMRDTYMDCPGRERAQWWGDLVNESGEAFYALSTESHALCKKGMYELIGWQREDSSLFSPIPSGNYRQELPGQMLSSIGYYGFWNYYLHTGDLETIADLYAGVRKYLKLWDFDDRYTVLVRKGQWTWGDWGEEKDMVLIYNALYYMALKGALHMAKLLEFTDDENEYQHSMENLKLAFNTYFWTGTAYRDPDYKGQTDDRSQALAVVAGLADTDKYPALLKVLKTEEHASPYMEKYVIEALFQMGYEEYALQRLKKRFAYMVNHPSYTTLFEGWNIGREGYGGGTINHAWSGGGLTILSQYLCGISPVKAGYTQFQVLPQPASIESASASVESVRGVIKSAFINRAGKFELSVTVPENTEAILGIPDQGFSKISVDGKTIWKNEKFFTKRSDLTYAGKSGDHIKFKVHGGNWSFMAE